MKFWIFKAKNVEMGWSNIISASMYSAHNNGESKIAEGTAMTLAEITLLPIEHEIEFSR